MGQVYECGLFTIASNLSDDGQPWLPPDPLPWALKLWKGGPHKAWLLELLTNSPLASRGWCLQERHLSPRLLHVYHKEVWVWECSSQVRGANCDGLVYKTVITDATLSWRKQNLSHALSRNQLLDCWDKLVVDYTKRQLTKQSDRLAAISGIECRLQPLLSSVYCAGIWDSDILSLLWYCGTVFYPDGEATDGTIDIPIWDGHSSDMPTWSWAASNKPVRFLTHRTSGHERGLGEVQEPVRWRAVREYFRHLGQISYHSTTSDQSNDIGWSIRLEAPIRPPGSDFPFLVSLDSIILRPESEETKRGRIYRRFKNSRDEAAKLHFVVLGVYYDTMIFGIILAPSKLCAGAFVRLGIWGDYSGDVHLADPPVKFEYTII
jgi:hypothetical protein